MSQYITTTLGIFGELQFVNYSRVMRIFNITESIIIMRPCHIFLTNRA